MQLRFSDEPARPDDLPALDAPGVHCWRDDDGSVIAYGCHQGGAHWMAWPDFATFRFSRADRHITAYPDPSVPPAAIESVFARSVLPMALQALGHESLHASAVLHPTRGVVVLAARSRVGKSTLAFGLSQRGLRQWADDGVVWKLAPVVGSPASAVPSAVPLPFKPRLRAASTAMFRESIGATGSIGAAQAQSARAPFANTLPLAPAPIAVIYLLERADGSFPGQEAAVVADLAQPDAFTAVLAHAHEFDPYDSERRAAMLKAYLELVAHTPVRRLRFRAGPEHLERLLTAIVRDLDNQPPGRREWAAR